MVHNAIMAKSVRKCARVLQLRNISDADSGQQQLSTPQV